MGMVLTDFERKILAGMVADLRAWRAWLRKYLADPDRPLRRYVNAECSKGEAATERREIGMDLAGWLGFSPDARVRMQASRAYSSLTAKGLITPQRYDGSDRASSIVVHPAAEKALRPSKPARTVNAMESPGPTEGATAADAACAT